MRKNRIRSASSSISSNSKFRKKFVPPRKLSAPLKPISNATSSNETKQTFKAPLQKFKPPTKTSFKPPKRSTGFAAPAFVSKPVDVSEKPTAKRYLYEVMFCKRSNKKRKTYDDGLLIISSKKKAYLKDMSGKDIAYSQAKFETMEEGETFLFGGWEAEVVKGVTEEEYTSGRFFIQNTVSVPVKRPVLPKMKKTVLPKGIRKSTTSLQQPRKKKLKQTFDPDRGNPRFDRPRDASLGEDGHALHPCGDEGAQLRASAMAHEDGIAAVAEIDGDRGGHADQARAPWPARRRDTAPLSMSQRSGLVPTGPPRGATGWLRQGPRADPEGCPRAQSGAAW